MSHFLRRCLMVVAMVVVGSTGCALVEAPGAGPSDQVQQALTGCELDCPGGQVFTCADPCSLPDANTLICNGVTTTCPACVPRTCADVGANCGPANDGCGHTLNCGSCGTGQQCIAGICETACPAGRVDCCDDGTCRTPLVCVKIGC